MPALASARPCDAGLPIYGQLLTVLSPCANSGFTCADMDPVRCQHSRSLGTSCAARTLSRASDRLPEQAAGSFVFGSQECTRCHLRRWKNGGVDGTTSSYMALCLSQHVDRDVDVVLVRSLVAPPQRRSRAFVSPSVLSAEVDAGH